MAGTLTIVLSADRTVPPKNTGKACASHVAGLNITGNVRFISPERICMLKVEEIRKEMVWLVLMLIKILTVLQVNYLVHDVIQIDYVVVEAFAFPSGANIAICVRVPIVMCRCIMNQFVQRAQLLEDLTTNHIAIAIFRGDNDTTETTLKHARNKEKTNVR